MDERRKRRITKEVTDIMPPGTHVYTSMVHRSTSGMLRHIDVYVMKKNRPIKLNCHIEAIGLFRRGAYNAKNADSLRVGGWGEDKGFRVVYDLGAAIYPNGFKCAGEKPKDMFYCPSNDHHNDHECDRIKGKHHHRDGGYALKQVWL